MTPRFSYLAIAGLFAGTTAFAQLPPAPPRGPMPTPPSAVAPEAGTTAQGRVAQWLINPNGEADGLLLGDGTQVAFPPHLSSAVMQILKPGDTVRVAGWRAPNVPVLRAQTLEANGRSVADQPPGPGMAPPAPRDPASLTAMSASGRIERLLYTDRGDVRGVMLDDKTTVRFPPHVGATYGAMLQPGGALFARGWGTRGPNGSAIEATGLGQTADGLRDVMGGPVPPQPQTPPLPPMAPPAPAAS